MKLSRRVTAAGPVDPDRAELVGRPDSASLPERTGGRADGAVGVAYSAAGARVGSKREAGEGTGCLARFGPW